MTDTPPQKPSIIDTVTTAFNQIGGMIKQYLIIIMAVVFLGVCWQGWKAYQKYENGQTQAKLEEDKRHKEELRILNVALDQEKAEKAALAVKNDTLAAEVEVWKQRAKNNPPPLPVPDPPKDVAVAVTDIAQSGVQFTVTVPKVGDDPILTGTAATPAKNVPTVWTWYKESLRVPALETSYATQVGLSTALITQVGGLQSEVAKGNEIVGQQGVVITKHVEREANLDAIVKDTQKEVKREKFNGYVKAGVAAVLSFFVGKGVAKR